MTTIEPNLYCIDDLPVDVRVSVIGKIEQELHDEFMNVNLIKWQYMFEDSGFTVSVDVQNDFDYIHFVANACFMASSNIRSVLEKIQSTFGPDSKLYDVAKVYLNDYQFPYDRLIEKLNCAYNEEILRDYLEFTSPRSIVNTIKEENLMFTFNGEMYV